MDANVWAGMAGVVSMAKKHMPLSLAGGDPSVAGRGGHDVGGRQGDGGERGGAIQQRVPPPVPARRVGSERGLDLNAGMR